MPHAGTELPDDIATRLTGDARALPDTDWHVDRLYDFAAKLGATVIRARYSRYVVDLNRPAGNTPMYPGAANTGVVPTECFDGSPLYRDDASPDGAEVERRLIRYWHPWHDLLRGRIDGLLARHGRVVLYDAHTIQSRVPRLFEGRLPDLNLGTNGGVSCATTLQQRLESVLADTPTHTHVVNGRFRGGHITRHYGVPERAVHAVQLELSQRTYLDEDASRRWREDRAARIRPVLRRLLTAALDWADAAT